MVFFKKNKYYIISFILYVIIASILWFQLGNLVKSNKDRDLVWDELTIIQYPPREHSIFIIRCILLFFGIVLVLNFIINRYTKGYIKAIALVLTVSLFFAAIEIASRIYLGKNHSLLRPHPTMLFEIIPGFEYPGYYATNSHHCMYPEFPLKKEPGEFRIVVVGDSTAYGIPVKAGERFSDQMEEKLREEFPGRKIRVINAAMASSSSMQIKNLVLERVYKFSPDCLVISLNNDALIAVTSDASRLPPKHLIPLYRLLYKTDLYLLLRRMIMIGKLSKEKPRRFPDAGYVPPDRPERVYSKNVVLRVNEQEAEENYRAMIKKMDEIGAKTIVLAMPLRDYIEFDMDKIDPKDPNVMHRRVMEKVCRENNAIFINIFDRWNKDPSNRKHFVDWVHVDKEGHTKITEQILDVIIDEKILE